jgi:hypothetical protein
MSHPQAPTHRPATLLRIAKMAAALAVAGAALLFLAQALHASWDKLQPVLLTPRVLVTALGLSAVYGITFFIPFAAWYYTLRRNSPARVPFGAAAHIYCLSNIAKYLPGSVMHFAGRQILGSRLGWSHLAIARATILEIAAMAGGVCIVVLVVGLSPAGGQVIAPALHQIGITPTYWRPAALLLAAAGLLALLPLARLQVFERLFGVPLKSALVVLLLDTLYFAIYGVMAAFFVQQLSLAPPAPEPAQIAIAFLVAWLVGFAIPGAPGGLGVRESMLVLLLAGTADGGSTTALALGLGMRFVNTLGDAICAGLAYLISRTATACAKA